MLTLPFSVVHGADPVDVRDIVPREFSQANEAYESWARALHKAYPEVGERMADRLGRRARVHGSDYWRTTTQLQRILSRRTEVPTPDISGAGEGGPILQIPLKAPWDILSPMPDLSIGMQPLEDPRVKITGKIEGSVLFVKKVMLASCQLTDDEPIWQTVNELKADSGEWFEGLLTQPMDHLPLNFSLSGGRLDEATGSFDVGVVSGGLGVRPTPDQGDTAFETFASGGVGMATPGTFKAMASASAKVDVEVSALARLTDPIYGTPYGRQTLNGALVKHIQAAMLTVFECPKCHALGERICDRCDNEHTITCPTCQAQGSIACSACADRRTVLCSSCRGERHYTCGNCNGQGWRSCQTTQSCFTCGGTGWDDCLWCSGSGTTQEEHSETRSQSVPRHIGFDENNNAIYKSVIEYYTKTWYEPVTCSSCSGRGGETCTSCNNGTVQCSTCGGDGRADCLACDGDGLADCRKCRGTGQMTCRTCRGKPVRCPQCKARPLRCPTCKGKPGRCPYCKGKKSWGGGS